MYELTDLFIYVQFYFYPFVKKKIDYLQLVFKKEVRSSDRPGRMAACVRIGVEESYSTGQTEAEAVHKACYGALVNTAYAFKTIPPELAKFYEKGKRPSLC